MSTRYEYYNTGDDNKRPVSDEDWGAQSFTPTVSHRITSIKLKMARWSLPGTVTVSIKATDGSGHPTGDDLCSGTTDGDTLPDQTTGVWREITLGAGYDLVASTKYAIVVRTEAAEVWWRHHSAGTYAGGNQMGSGDSGVNWGDFSACDFMFEEWGVLDYERTLTTAIGLLPTLTRGLTTFGRTLSTAIGLDAILDGEASSGGFLCVASHPGGSMKTRTGATWTVCAKTAAGGLSGSYFAQYLNRLCVLNYDKIGFSFSEPHDIQSNWTNKPNFPNLPQRFTELFVGRDAGDDPVLNFLTPIGMYYLDVFTNFHFGPTELTWEEDDLAGKKGLYWKGEHYIAVGKGIYKISQGVVDLIGPDMDDGVPEDLQGVITDMLGVGFWLVIAIDGGVSKKSCIMKRYITGKHWHPVYVGSLNTPIQALFWDSGTLYFGEGTNVKSLPFPNVTDNVKQLTDHNYCATGEIIYPYFHSIFEAMPKVAHNVWAVTEDCNSNEKITISYRIDEATGWTPLGSFTASPRPPALPFPAAGDSIGVAFERIQFKAAFARDAAVTTNSPKLESLILEYRVTPPVLWGWDVRVLATTTHERRGQDIIDALITAIEKGTLLSFYPGGDKSGTEYFVEVKGMPGVKKGTEFGEEGIYTVSLQEVVD